MAMGINTNPAANPLQGMQRPSPARPGLGNQQGGGLDPASLLQLLEALAGGQDPEDAAEQSPEAQAQGGGGEAGGGGGGGGPDLSQISDLIQNLAGNFGGGQGQQSGAADGGGNQGGAQPTSAIGDKKSSKNKGSKKSGTSSKKGGPKAGTSRPKSGSSAPKVKSGASR